MTGKKKDPELCWEDVVFEENKQDSMFTDKLKVDGGHIFRSTAYQTDLQAQTDRLVGMSMVFVPDTGKRKD